MSALIGRFHELSPEASAQERRALAGGLARTIAPFARTVPTEVFPDAAVQILTAHRNDVVHAAQREVLDLLVLEIVHVDGGSDGVG